MNFLHSSIGKKVVVAVTGLVLLGFVMAHLAGNLLIFAGQNALNAYAEKLRHLGGLLWVARGVLLFSVLIHIVFAIQLAIANRAARPISYKASESIQTTVAAKSMMLSGLAIFAFIVFHLLHFTFRVTHPEISHLTDSLGRHDVYSMVVLSFQDRLLAAIYVAAMALLSAHLGHGASSWIQTLGLVKEGSLKTANFVGQVFAVALALGYVAIPTSIYLGWIRLASGANCC